VAAGIAESMGLDPVLIRVAFVVLCFAQGAGAVLYIAALAVSAPGEPERVRPARSGTRQVLGIACIVAGLLIALRAAGYWFGDEVVWPLATIALGSTFVWTRADAPVTARSGLGLKVGVGSQGTFGTIRMVLGFGLVIVGTGAVLRAYSPVSLGRVVFPIAVAVAGLLLALGPWLLRLSRQLSDERRERIRSEERSAMAAHLHDSVLQTLALIQRTRSPQEVATLARQQERELRSWLYGKRPASDASTFRAALDAMAARMEKVHRIPIEAIIVGDAQLDDDLQGLVQAAGEAMNNAGRHSGATAVSVYAEVEDNKVAVYVRDEGSGFDPASVPEDRRGIADSIRGRIARSGGSAEVNTARGAGTEVKIELPRRAS
jgi:signal transduction histidine kinase/phage shock protein PspC (stress-responsive transcriptional regulator)